MGGLESELPLCWGSFCCQNQAVDTVISIGPPRVLQENLLQGLGPLALSVCQGRLGKLQRLPPVLSMWFRQSQAQLGWVELCLPRECRQAFTPPLIKRLIILLLGPEIQSKTLWLLFLFWYPSGNGAHCRMTWVSKFQGIESLPG